jgi:lysophospholipase L1-like esterase
MYKVLIVGDSLNMVRTKSDICYEDTVQFNLKKSLRKYFEVEVFNSSKRTNDSSRILKSNDEKYYDFIQYSPDFVIINIGIVDCAPRLFTRKERLIVANLPVIGRSIVHLMSKHRYFITKHYQKVYVKKEDFYKNIDELIIFILKEVKAVPIVVNIAHPKEETLSRSYNYLRNICTYNQILDTISKKYNLKIIDFHKATKENPSLLLEDGYHISKMGHKKLSKMICKTLYNYISNNTESTKFEF